MTPTWYSVNVPLATSQAVNRARSGAAAPASRSQRWRRARTSSGGSRRQRASALQKPSTEEGVMRHSQRGVGLFGAIVRQRRPCDYYKGRAPAPRPAGGRPGRGQRLMGYANLRECLADLQRHGQLARIDAEVDPHLEMAEVHRRVYQAGGPALLFTRVKGCAFPMASNLFGTLERTRLLFRDTLPTLRRLFELKIDPSSFWKRPWQYL